MGSNVDGKLGFGKSKKRRMKFFPAKISLSAIVSVSCGKDHAVAVNAYNAVYAWGFNKSEQLGLGDDKNQCFPCRVKL
jgi:alpha-tubulin suppressor-like RCC1 family protein